MNHTFRRQRMLDAHTPSEKDISEFNSYMLFKLQSSSAFVEHLEQRNQQAINFYIVLITTLIGGGVVAIATIPDLPLKLSIVAFDILFMGAYGMLTYIWLLATITEEIHESFIQSFLYKYFR